MKGVKEKVLEHVCASMGCLGINLSRKAKKAEGLEQHKNCSVRRTRKGKENNDKSFLLSVPSSQFLFCGKVIGEPTD